MGGNKEKNKKEREGKEQETEERWGRRRGRPNLP